jgi:protocatechuate 3,4-dioxygenase beta subunit
MFNNTHDSTDESTSNQGSTGAKACSSSRSTRSSSRSARAYSDGYTGGPGRAVALVALVALSAVGLQVAPVLLVDSGGVASAAPGDKQWNTTVGSNVWSSPTVADGTVYVGSEDDTLYALDASDGSKQWSFTTGNNVRSSPTVADGTVYIGSNDGSLYALDAADGSQQWSFTAGDDIRSSPTVADGTVYVGSRDDNVYAVEASDAGANSEGTRTLHGTLGHNDLFTADGLIGEPVSGTVTDADGNPVDNATVEAVNTSTGTTEAATQINATGGYEVGVDAGEYDITASADGYDTTTKTVDVPEGGTTVSFELLGQLGSFTFLGPDRTEITDRETRVELYEASDEEEALREPRYWLDETTREPIATGSGSSIQVDAIGDERNEWYVVAFRSEDGAETQYRDSRFIYAPGTNKTRDWTMYMSGKAEVQQRVAIDDRTDGNWPSKNVTIRAERISGDGTTTRARLGSSNLGTMWLNDSTSYRIYAERDDGTERRIGRLDVVRETSDHPAVFEILPPADQFNESDIQNRTDDTRDPWSTESEITYPPLATVSADPAAPVAGDSVTFDASGSTAYGDASISSYEWELPDGTTTTGSTATWSTDSMDAGRTPTVTVTVTDSNGIEDTATHNLYVAEDAASAAIPPTADARIDTDDPIVGEPVVLEEASSTGDGVDIETVEWDVDNDGTYEETGSKVEFTPEEAGLRTVALRVTDDNGVEDEIDVSFFVGAETSGGENGLFGGGSGGGGGGGFGPAGGGSGGPTGAQQAALGIAGIGAYALWRRSGGPGVVAVARRGAPMVASVGTRALSSVGTLVRGTGRVARRLVGAVT